ncbi:MULTISPECIES: hypothetical protein [unclassified Streptomyces]|uniref:hypothetical protein n=1 Tax=unclassified Streptomyces TaxID=2593676 RepID=UPI00382770BC
MTMAAKAMVTSVGPKWSRAWYSGHSGVGAVPKAIKDKNATATDQNPKACRFRSERGVAVVSVVVVIAVPQWSTFEQSAAFDAAQGSEHAPCRSGISLQGHDGDSCHL